MQQLSSVPSAEKEKVKIKNIVAKSAFLQPFSINQLSSDFPLDTTNPYQVRIPIRFLNVKFSILRTGTVIARAASSFDELQEAFDWLRSYLDSSFNLQLSSSYQVINIAAVTKVSSIPPPFNLFQLASFLPQSSYDPSPILVNYAEHLLDAVVYHFNHDCEIKPRRTALIFHTGKITLIGFNSLFDLFVSASKLESIIARVASEHPEVLGGA
jgi:TATA-box binding protein (TBP) (component of TFIID and TFIIIB)